MCVIGDEVLLRSLITLVMVVMELGHMITPATTHYYHYQITRHPPPHPQPWEYATDIEEFTPLLLQLQSTSDVHSITDDCSRRNHLNLQFKS